MEQEAKKTLHVIVYGNVQGVCFRATAQTHAEAQGVTGTAKNLPDGTVELYLYGTEKQLHKMLSELKERPGMGRVDHFEKIELSPVKAYDSFTILFK